MTADEEQVLVLELLQSNGGCRLPCWWGFTPGETAWQTTETFFTSHGKSVGKYSDPRYARYTSYSVSFDIPHHVTISQHYLAYYDTIRSVSVHAYPPVYDTECAHCDTGYATYYAYGDPQFAIDMEPYTLHQMLTTYGQPQVFVMTYSADLPGYLPFRLVLFYPDQGILMRYEGPAGEEGWLYGPIDLGENIPMCPWRTSINLRLWSPERELTFVQALYESGDSNVRSYRSLEEATGMSINQFYEAFAQSGNRDCLETPAEMW